MSTMSTVALTIVGTVLALQPLDSEDDERALAAAAAAVAIVDGVMQRGSVSSISMCCVGCEG